MAARLPASMRTVVSAQRAPKAIGPYSHGIRSGRTLYVSGQIGIDPTTGDLVKGGIENEVEQALKNLGAVLEAGKSSFDRVLKTTILLKDMNDFAKVNTIYGKYFSKDPPARATYAVAGLPKGALVEIEAIAECDE